MKTCEEIIFYLGFKVDLIIRKQILTVAQNVRKLSFAHMLPRM